MARKIIISLAPVKAGEPVDRAALAEDVARSAALGASMCHLHCRRPDGSLTPDTAEFIATFEEINEYLKENAREGDLVLTLGSGDVYKQSRLFVK